MTDCVEAPVCIGPFVVGERPNTLTYQFLNSDGTVIDLTGFTAVYVVREQLGSATQFAAAVDAPPTGGTVSYTWTGAEFPTPGHYVSEFWVGDGGSRRYASVLVTFRVRLPVGLVPAI